MIPRYSRPEMARIWSEENKFATWLRVEIAALHALSAAGIASFAGAPSPSSATTATTFGTSALTTAAIDPNLLRGWGVRPRDWQFGATVQQELLDGDLPVVVTGPQLLLTPSQVVLQHDDFVCQEADHEVEPV